MIGYTKLYSQIIAVIFQDLWGCTRKNREINKSQNSSCFQDCLEVWETASIRKQRYVKKLSHILQKSYGKFKEAELDKITFNTRLFFWEEPQGLADRSWRVAASQKLRGPVRIKLSTTIINFCNTKENFLPTPYEAIAKDNSRIRTSARPGKLCINQSAWVSALQKHFCVESVLPR